ncbi:nudix domain-containing protein [Xylariales sp. AK1849]|nr:nudix domain-containing protein [Xylariales sp. AK1849]
MAPDTSNVHPRVGVAALIRNANGEIVIGKRLGSHGSGSWAVPGGHLEFGESFFACAERETLEETGLEVTAKKLVSVTNDVFEDLGKHYITLFVACERIDTEKDPQNLEPEKCELWKWSSWNEILEWATEGKLFIPMRNLVREHPNIAEML